MDLVDKEHVAGLEARQDGGEVTYALNRGTGCDADADLHLGGDDVGKSGLAEAGRTVEQHVIERLTSLARRLDADADVVLDLLLVDVVGEALRPQRRVGLQVAFLRLTGHGAFGAVTIRLRLWHRGSLPQCERMSVFRWRQRACATPRAPRRRASGCSPRAGRRHRWGRASRCRACGVRRRRGHLA